MFPMKFVFSVALWLSVFSFCYVESQEVAGDVMPSPTVCLNCTICQYPCHPLPPPAPPSSPSGFPLYEVPPPPPPSSPPPPAQVSQGNCPPIPVQCCNYPPHPPYGYVPPYVDSAGSPMHLSYLSAKVFAVMVCCFVLGVQSQNV